MGTHPIFESDFDCLTEMFRQCNRITSTNTVVTTRLVRISPLREKFLKKWVLFRGLTISQTVEWRQMVAESDREGLMRLEKSALEKHSTHFKFGNLWFTIIYKGMFFLVTVSLATIAFFMWWSLTLEFDRRVQGLGHNLIRKILIEAGEHKAMENREVLPYVANLPSTIGRGQRNNAFLSWLFQLHNKEIYSLFKFDEKNGTAYIKLDVNMPYRDSSDAAAQKVENRNWQLIAEAHVKNYNRNDHEECSTYNRSYCEKINSVEKIRWVNKIIDYCANPIIAALLLLNCLMMFSPEVIAATKSPLRTIRPSRVYYYLFVFAFGTMALKSKVFQSLLLSDAELEQCGLPIGNKDGSMEGELVHVEKALKSGFISRIEQWLSTRIYAPSVRTAQFEFLSRRSAWEIDTLQLMLLDKNGKPEKAAWLKHPKLL